MKFNKAIYMVFGTGESSAEIYINVPIKVKKIVCKAVSYVTGTLPTPGTGEYAFVISNLTGNQPIAMIYQDSTNPVSMFSDIIYEFPVLQMVQGTYVFNLLGIDGVPMECNSVSGDTLGMILEFSDENE